MASPDGPSAAANDEGTARSVARRQPGAGIHATFESPSSVFIEKEWEVIYLLVRGMKIKQISSIPAISVDAVNGRLRSCYRKAGLNAVSALTDYCPQSQFDNYIPALFLKKGHIVIRG